MRSTEISSDGIMIGGHPVREVVHEGLGETVCFMKAWKQQAAEHWLFPPERQAEFPMVRSLSARR
jgi:hypothetical protein